MFEELELALQSLPTKALDLAVRILITVIVFLVGMKLIKLVRRILRKSLTHADAELGVIQFLDAFVKYALYALLIFAIATNFGFDATSIVALLGSAGVTIGLALQGSLSNFAGGVLILLLKPFKVGDYITEDTNGNSGTVKEIGLFYTKLATGDNKIVILPNGTLANSSLTNASQATVRRVDLTVGISYNADIDKAKAVIREIIETDPKVFKNEDILVYVDSLGSSEVVLGARCYCSNSDYWEVRWRLLETIKKSFDEQGIEIPFPQLTVHIEQ
ncbi:MAG: mechanosensitive ion channel [Lachnospiraceae bacterium]|nr:mechanosensitive ion channel [Lachnospiraceae bacterium]